MIKHLVYKKLLISRSVYLNRPKTKNPQMSQADCLFGAKYKLFIIFVFKTVKWPMLNLCRWQPLEILESAVVPNCVFCLPEFLVCIFCCLFIWCTSVGFAPCLCCLDKSTIYDTNIDVIAASHFWQRISKSNQCYSLILILNLCPWRCLSGIHLTQDAMTVKKSKK